MGRKQISQKFQQPCANEMERVPASPNFPVAILDEARNEFSFGINSVQISASGVIFLMGWTDDRSSKLLQIRLRGQAWSKAIDSEHIGRHRHQDAEISAVTVQQRLYGFWALAPHERSLIDGNSCSVELVLTNGVTKSGEVSMEFISAEELRAHFGKFWNDLAEEDRLPPIELTQLELALKRSSISGEIAMPKHNVETISISEEGGLFVNGWIDDTNDTLQSIRISGNDGQVIFEENALARTGREDVQVALAIAQRHAFGFWCFAANEVVQRRGNNINIDLLMNNGARQRREVPVQSVEQSGLRDTVLTYLAASQHLGNAQLEAVAGLDNYIGRQIVDCNLRLSRKITSQPYVERFGDHSKKRKGSIVVCLYGKPEYLFLQNSLFTNRPGIEDYEFIYICNSPELAEPLLRDAHIASSTYDINQTLVVLPGNAGFGAANNAAVRFAQTDRVLVVNPDVFPFDQDWAVKHTDIVEQLPREQTTIFGAPLYYDDGSLMHGGMYFEADRGVSIGRSQFSSMMFLRVEHYGKGAPPLTERFVRSRAVPAVTGAFISLDRKWFEKIGGFSEDYIFGHYEDADLCLKSLEKGVAPWIHDVKLWHLEGKGSHRLPVHEGATIVNRWLFNKRWASKVIPDMLGQSPKLSSLEIAILENVSEAAAISISPKILSRAKLRDVPYVQEPKVMKPINSVGLHNHKVKNRPSSGDIEIVFGAK
jgi:GT2 family glycosyltransferase